jgi:LacI family transcriptional regulator
MMEPSLRAIRHHARTLIHQKSIRLVSVPHRFLVKDIAFQAGLSTATVDRVLHAREGVRNQTRSRVDAAIRELERQEANLARGGRTFMIDIVMEAPERFSNEVRSAFEQEAGSLHPNVFRARFHGAELMDEDKFIRILDRIRLRGSDGVVVKARDTRPVNDAVHKIIRAGIPVITLVTDLPQSGRLAYAGMNNRAAGETAAYLIAQTLGHDGGTVLATLSSTRFRGEDERVEGFRAALLARHKTINIVEISEGFGRDQMTGELARRALMENPDICAVYSAGGGNHAVLGAFDKAARACRVYVAHDLDAENRKLLAEGQINYVLHHDLRQDVRSVYRHFANHHVPVRSSQSALSEIAVITPFNMPVAV